MKSLAIVACFLMLACALDGQTYQPRLNFGARLEPQGALIHGAGQSPDTFAGYWGVMPAGRQPMVYMWYIGLAGLSSNWSDQLKAQLLLYPNSFIIPQVGLNMTNGVTAAGVSESYEAQVAAGAYDQQIANLVTGLQRLATPPRWERRSHPYQWRPPSRRKPRQKHRRRNPRRLRPLSPKPSQSRP